MGAAQGGIRKVYLQWLACSSCTEGAFSRRKFLLSCVSLFNNNNNIHFLPSCWFAKSNGSLQQYYGEWGHEDENYCPSPSPKVRYRHHTNDKNVLAASQMCRKRIAPSRGFASLCQLGCQVGQLNPKLLEKAANGMKEGRKIHGGNTSSGLWHRQVPGSVLGVTPAFMVSREYMSVTACAPSRSCAETGSHNSSAQSHQRPQVSGERMADLQDVLTSTQQTWGSTWS